MASTAGGPQSGISSNAGAGGFGGVKLAGGYRWCEDQGPGLVVPAYHTCRGKVLEIFY